MNRARIEPMLLGRWIAITNGEVPGPDNMIEQLIYGSDYTFNRQNGGRAKRACKQIKQLVSSLDEKARQTYASTSGSEEDRQTVGGGSN